jgi:hypothetical protein
MLYTGSQMERAERRAIAGIHDSRNAPKTFEMITMEIAERSDRRGWFAAVPKLMPAQGKEQGSDTLH